MRNFSESPLPFNPHPRLHAELLVVVLYLLHVGDELAAFDKPVGGIPAGDDELRAVGFGLQELAYVVWLDEAEMQRNGEFVEDNHVPLIASQGFEACVDAVARGVFILV